MFKKNIKYFAILVAGILLGYLFGNFKELNIKTQIFSKLEEHQGGDKLTNPLLECLGGNQGDSVSQLNISESELNVFVNKRKNLHNLDTVSVYVRDLNDGPWIGINEKEDFIGGSLLKVPMLISYLKLAEKDPSVLKKEIEYKVKYVDNIQYFESSKEIELGQEYSVEELLQYMIEYSDNNAAYLLSQNIDPKEFDRVFEALGFGIPDINKSYPVNTKTYAAFFRVLFNTSYLNKDFSEKALSILTSVEFNKGLQALLPKDLVVAHKFGIRTDGAVNQLHDCGIVYYPNHPYLICIMSRGGTFDEMSSFIAEVSKFVYDKISQINR